MLVSSGIDLPEIAERFCNLKVNLKADGERSDVHVTRQLLLDSVNLCLRGRGSSQNPSEV